MTEQQLLRQAKRRLAILQHAEEVTGNVAATCHYYGISRQSPRPQLSLEAVGSCGYTCGHKGA